jgi:hypothetical protein
MANLSANGGTKRRIWVSGHRGMVGSAILRRLVTEAVEILTVDRGDVDLREQQFVRQSSPLPRLAESLPTTLIQPISCSIISRLRRMSSRPRIWPMSSGWSFLDRLAFIRNSRRSRSRKKRC